MVKQYSHTIGVTQLSWQKLYHHPPSSHLAPLPCCASLSAILGKALRSVRVTHIWQLYLSSLLFLVSNFKYVFFFKVWMSGYSMENIDNDDDVAEKYDSTEICTV
jgi:hypothetical protein